MNFIYILEGSRSRSESMKVVNQSQFSTMFQGYKVPLTFFLSKASWSTPLSFVL